LKIEKDLLKTDHQILLKAGPHLNEEDSTKSKKAMQYRMPTKLWRLLKKHCPSRVHEKGPGRESEQPERIGWHLACVMDGFANGNRLSEAGLMSPHVSA
jgi:hypothetical protein